jgi:hypothetical protein
LHLPLHFVPDTKDFVFDTKYDIQNTMSNPEHDHGASQPGGTDAGPTTPPITNSRGESSQTVTRYVPLSAEQWRKWRRTLNEDDFSHLVLTHASARDLTLHQMLDVIQGYLDSENIVSPSNQGNTSNDDIHAVQSSDSDNGRNPTVSSPAATPTANNGSPQAPTSTTPSEMFSRGGMAIGRFIRRVRSDFKSAMESDEGKATQKKIKVGMKDQDPSLAPFPSQQRAD